MGLALAYLDLGLLKESRPILDKLNKQYPNDKEIKEYLAALQDMGVFALAGVWLMEGRSLRSKRIQSWKDLQMSC